MKISKLAIIATTILGSSLAMAADPAQGGKVHFVGTIVNAACAISADSVDQTVKLGEYRTAHFKATGDKSGIVPFNINLVDCDTEVSEKAIVKFNGVADLNDATVLAVSNTANGASGAATGVGIEIADAQGKVLTPNNIVTSSEYTLNNGNNSLGFSARYKSTTDTVTPGEANADATFTISYL